MRYALIAILALLMTAPAIEAADRAEREPQVYFFWTTDCPGCAAAQAFLDRARLADPAIRVREFDVEANLSNAMLLAQVYERVGLAEFLVVPLVIVGTNVVIGFDDEAGLQVLNHIKDCRQRDCRDIVQDLIREPNEAEQAVLR
jgi:hypothetical protein